MASTLSGSERALGIPPSHPSAYNLAQLRRPGCILLVVQARTWGLQDCPLSLSLTHTQLIDKSYRLYFPNRFMLRRASCRLRGDTWAQASLVPHPGYGNSFLQSTSSPFVSLKSALGMVAKRSFFFFFKRDAIHINPLFKILQKLFRFTKSQVSTMKYKTRPLP